MTPTITPDAVSIEITNGQPTTTSLDVAQHFKKRHDDVLKRIRSLDCSPEFYARNFAEIQTEAHLGKGRIRKDPAYRLTRDGFVFLCMGFTGKRAAQWKEAYINAFNLMEQQLQNRQQPELSYPQDCWYQLNPQLNHRLALRQARFHITADLLYGPDANTPISHLLNQLNNRGYDIEACRMELMALRHHLETTRNALHSITRTADFANTTSLSFRTS